jgi:PEGA domain
MRTLSALLLLPLTACATMMGGAGPAHVPIDSVPQGAIVSYDGANVGVTPCTVVMTARCSRVELGNSQPLMIRQSVDRSQPLVAEISPEAVTSQA